MNNKTPTKTVNTDFLLLPEVMIRKTNITSLHKQGETCLIRLNDGNMILISGQDFDEAAKQLSVPTPSLLSLAKSIKR